MQTRLKSIIAASLLSLAIATPAVAGNMAPKADKADGKPQTVKITVDQFEKDQAALNSSRDTIDVEAAKTIKANKDHVFLAEETFEVAPIYELDDQSVAFIGTNTMNDDEFVAYQRSALTPEGRITEPMESLAAVGIRSKF